MTRPPLDSWVQVASFGAYMDFETKTGDLYPSDDESRVHDTQFPLCLCKVFRKKIRFKVHTHSQTLLCTTSHSRDSGSWDQYRGNLVFGCLNLVVLLLSECVTQPKRNLNMKVPGSTGYNLRLFKHEVFRHFYIIIIELFVPHPRHLSLRGSDSSGLVFCAPW